MDVGRLRIIIICDAQIYVFSRVELHWRLLNFRGVSFIHLSRRSGIYREVRGVIDLIPCMDNGK